MELGMENTPTTQPQHHPTEFVISAKKKKHSDDNVNIEIKPRECKYCGKTFKRRRYFEKHILLCEQLRNDIHIPESKYILQAELEEDEDTLSMGDTKRLLMILLKKCETLEKRVQTLEGQNRRIQKHIRIEEWLDANVKPEKHFLEWVASFEVSRTQTEYVFENDFILGTLHTLQSMFPIETREQHPIRCFQHKQGVFYIYDEDASWKVMQQHTFEKMFMLCIQKFLKWFYVWKDENIEKIENDEEYHDKYVLYMRRVMGTTKKDELNHRLVRTKLFHYLKSSIKQLIEYEYT